MRRLVISGLVIALHAVPTAQVPAAGRPMQADAVVRLLADLEAALATGRAGDLGALAAASLPDADRRVFETAVTGGPATTVAVRERARRPSESGDTEILAEVFMARGRHGRIATWQIGTRPRAGAPDRAELTGLAELESINELLQLSLDTARQFAVHDLVLSAPDLTLRMATGSAFVADSDTGTTGLVLRGRGEIQFAPRVAAERVQLRQFTGKPDLTVPIDAVFVRINPAVFAQQTSERSLQPVAVDAAEAARAMEIFNLQAPRSYNLDLRDLARDRWSLEPSFGSLVVEFRSRRFGWLTYARSPSEPEDISLFDRDRRRNIAIYASQEKLAERGEFYSDNDRSVYAVEHYGLDLRFDPTRSWVAGHATVRLRILQPTGSLTLKLAEPLVVTSLSSDAFGRLLNIRIVGQNSFIVGLPRVVLPDQVLTLEVEYSGRLEPQSPSRETIAPSGQTSQSPPSPTELLLVPEPRFIYSNSLSWYPQGGASDYATATMRLTVPSEYQLIASGTLVKAALAPLNPSDLEVNARDERYVRTVEYRTDRPVRYLSCVISRFVPAGRTRVDVPALPPVAKSAGMMSQITPLLATAQPGVNIEVVATPRQVGRSRALTSRTGEVIQFYAKLIGEAPYPDFTLVGVDDNLPGGHSPAFFALLQQPLPTSPYTWSSDPVAFDNFSSFFLAHEIAHQWWGQAVGWKNYHDQWLSEGLAQYFAVLYAEHDRGADTARNVISQMRGSAAAVADRGPIYLGYRLGQVLDDSRVFRAIAYNKSAVVLHMLRRLIGDDAFMRGLRRFYTTWRFQKAGTDDLRAAFEAETSMKLDRFFRRWIMDFDLPRLRITAREDPGGQVALVRIEQLGEVFDFPYSVTLQYQDGTSEVVTIPVTSAVTEQRLPLAGPLRRIDTRDDLTLATVVK